MSSWSPTKYKTRNWPSYNTALKQRGSLSIWFDPEMSWHAPPTGKRGRQPAFNDAAIQVCLTMKVLFGMPLRQTTGFVESLLRLAGLDWKVPDFSTLWGHCIKVALLSGSCERMENLCGIAKTIFPQWPEAIWVEWGVHVPQIIPGQTDMGPAKRRDVFGDFGWDGDTVIPQISD